MIISGGGERAENSTALQYYWLYPVYYPVSRTVYAYRTGRNIRIIICCHHVCSVPVVGYRYTGKVLVLYWYVQVSVLVQYRYEYVLEQGKQLFSTRGTPPIY